MTLHLTAHRDGFAAGLTMITRFDEPEDDTGIAMGVLKLRDGEVHETTTDSESAYLLMSGEAEVTVGNRSATLQRGSLFEGSPSCVHAPTGTNIRLAARGETEFTVYHIRNDKGFEPKIYQPDDTPNEHRGKGQVGNACYRFVRTIFDGSSADPNTEMVLGEVVTMPGRWSSYPPHNHPQPEIYHYRFTDPRGFGYGELGERVLKIRPYDSVKIFHPDTHCQTAAPGYGMYYAWVIRHLPDNRYTIPDFAEEHRWTMEPGATAWQPSDVDPL